MEQTGLIYKICNLYRYNKNVSIHLYPKCKKNEENIIEKKKYSIDFLTKFRKALSKYEKTEVNQNEYYFRDILKLTVDEITSYHTKRTIYLSHNGDILVGTILENITESQFPLLTGYDYENNKFIEIYKNTMINVFIINNEHICIGINKKPDGADEKKLMKKQIDEVYDLL
jgi:hypothetical protein